MELTGDEAKRLLVALTWGDPAIEGQADPALEAVKQRLRDVAASSRNQPQEENR